MNISEFNELWDKATANHETAIILAVWSPKTNKGYDLPARRKISYRWQDLTGNDYVNCSGVTVLVKDLHSVMVSLDVL